MPSETLTNTQINYTILFILKKNFGRKFDIPCRCVLVLRIQSTLPFLSQSVLSNTSFTFYNPSGAHIDDVSVYIYVCGLFAE